MADRRGAGAIASEMCPTRASGDQCARTRGHDGWHALLTSHRALAWGDPNEDGMVLALEALLAVRRNLV